MYIMIYLPSLCSWITYKEVFFFFFYKTCSTHTPHELCIYGDAMKRLPRDTVSRALFGNAIDRDIIIQHFSTVYFKHLLHQFSIKYLLITVCIFVDMLVCGSHTFRCMCLTLAESNIYFVKRVRPCAYFGVDCVENHPRTNTSSHLNDKIDYQLSQNDIYDC